MNKQLNLFSSQNDNKKKWWSKNGLGVDFWCVKCRDYTPRNSTGRCKICKPEKQENNDK